jgi:hypothetical protein
MSETAELKQYPSLRIEVGNATIDALEKLRDESQKSALKLVDMECNYLTVDFFRKLPQDLEKGGNPSQLVFDRYNETYFHRIGNLCLCQCLLYIIHYRSFCHDFSYVMKRVLFIT